MFVSVKKREDVFLALNNVCHDRLLSTYSHVDMESPQGIWVYSTRALSVSLEDEWGLPTEGL